MQASGIGMMQDHGVEPQPGPLPRSGPGCQQGMLESGLRQGPGQQLHPNRVAVIDGAGSGVDPLPVNPFELTPEPRRATGEIDVPTERVGMAEDPGAAVRSADDPAPTVARQLRSRSRRRR